MASFDEIKATEAAAQLLALRGGTMHFLKLLKLLYIADRRALQRWGIPISHDRYVSMDHGPVLSQTYNLIRDGGSRFWSEHISPPFGYEVKLIGEPQVRKLSRAEQALLGEVFAEYGARSRWELVEQTHQFSEWKNPHGGSIPIEIEDILDALGEDPVEIDAILAELGYERKLNRRLKSASAA